MGGAETFRFWAFGVIMWTLLGSGGGGGAAAAPLSPHDEHAPPAAVGRVAPQDLHFMAAQRNR